MLSTSSNTLQTRNSSVDSYRTRRARYSAKGKKILRPSYVQFDLTVLPALVNLHGYQDNSKKLAVPARKPLLLPLQLLVSACEKMILRWAKR